MDQRSTELVRFFSVLHPQNWVSWEYVGGQILCLYAVCTRSASLKARKMFTEAAVWWWMWPTLFLFLMPMTWVPVVDSSLSCNQTCKCQVKVLEVNCCRRFLVTVPEGLPSTIQLLDLSQNRLRMLSHWHFSGLVHLQVLDLSENSLSMIEVGTFRGLQSLHTLRIKSNRLKIIPIGLFSGLHSLCMLDISRNEIVIFLDYTFRELASLQHLEAGDNDLLFISPHAFVGLHSLQELNLEGTNLTIIPKEALSQLQALVRLCLRWLNHSMLPNNSFRRLSHLRTLTISHCPSLETLASNSLFGLNLTSLTISHSNLTSVPYTPIHNLVYLSYLDLSYNPITAIQANLLGNLIRLQEFHLVGGSLLRIEPGAFRGLAHFQLLNVSSNQLRTLEEAAFHSVSNLEILRLDNNPLACDCRLLWLAQRQLSLDFDGQQPSCASPAKVQGHGFRYFTDAMLPGIFTCRPARVLNRNPQEVQVEEGNSVLLYCKVDGDPMPSITWLTPRLTVVSAVGRIRAQINGTLEVRFAQLRDSGAYVCVVSNTAGNDSLSVDLHVRGVSSYHNRSSPFFLEGWIAPSAPSTSSGFSQNRSSFPFDAKTVIIAVTMGFLSFLSSMATCFVFMFFLSQSKIKIKRTANIDFVPRPSDSSGRSDSSKYNMKLM